MPYARLSGSLGTAVIESRKVSWDYPKEAYSENLTSCRSTALVIQREGIPSAIAPHNPEILIDGVHHVSITVVRWTPRKHRESALV